MNIAITTNCNKNCSYCFAKHHRETEDKRNMTIDQFKEILSKLREGESLKLLGGEPTAHKNFNLFLDVLIQQKRDFVLISNFLFSDIILEKIIEATKYININFLINATELDEKNRIERWSKNYNTLYSHLYQTDKEMSISCGITIEKNKDWKYYANYIDFLSKNVHNIERLRLSMAFPDGDLNQEEDFYFINNHELGETFLILTKKCLDSGIVPSLDCIIYPCMFSSKEEYKFIYKFLQNFKTTCDADSAPMDVFPNNEFIFCYPTKSVIKNNVENFETGLDMRSFLKEEYTNKMESLSIPEICLNCIHYKSDCMGPCLGFHKHI